MEDELVSYAVARLLHSVGFVDGSHYYYTLGIDIPIRNEDKQNQPACYINGFMENLIECPSIAVAQKWIREKKSIHATALPVPKYNKHVFWKPVYYLLDPWRACMVEDGSFCDYESAMNVALENSLEYIKNLK